VDLLFKGVSYTSAIRDATKRGIFLSPSVAVASSRFLYIVGSKADVFHGLTVLIYKIFGLFLFCA
jgi:hypothetical protein